MKIKRPETQTSPTPRSSTSSKATESSPSPQVAESSPSSSPEDRSLREGALGRSSISYSDLTQEALRLLLPSPVSLVSPWSLMGSELGSLQLLIPIVPASVQKGNRTTVVAGRVRHYPDRNKVAYYARIAEELVHQRRSEPLVGPVAVSYRFFMERPGYLKKPKSDPMAIPHDQKPDFDNLAKGFGDALGQSSIFTDDKQIWAAFVFKMYHELSLFPRIEVDIIYERQ